MGFSISTLELLHRIIGREIPRFLDCPMYNLMDKNHLFHPEARKEYKDPVKQSLKLMEMHQVPA